ncbi:MAG: type III pantothenate kinase [Victivallales bacterium]|nr:type III pantothenate kinase [Victivallales bacterium]
MKIFVLNIGNTNTQFATFHNGKFDQVNDCPTNQIGTHILPHDKSIHVAIVSVVPEKSQMFDDPGIFHLSPAVKTKLDTSLIDLSSIGMDRLANAIALANFAKLPAICIDCGTAITFEVVDSKNIFRGGAIMPGRMLLRKALNLYTAKLPLVECFGGKRSFALGVNTTEAIVSGCDIGILGAAQKLIEKMRIELGVEKCQVIATGGDREFFADNLLEVSSGGDDFTLRGLVAAFRSSKQTQNKKQTEPDGGSTAV